jgi:hypothetical protein
MMRKLLVCAALFLLASAGAAGQEGAAPRAGAPQSALPEDAGAEAARLLRARGSRERAWGAYYAGAYGLKEHAPLVVALLEDADGADGGWEESSVKRAALDALIRLNADVPPEKLLPLYQLAPDETIILLAREPERNAGALLTLFSDETASARWVAVGNLLAEALAKGFAARLLAGLKLKASVYVYDQEGERGFNSGRGTGCGGSSHFTLLPDGFPPFDRYALTTTPRRGAVVVARGRQTVYYVRAGPERGLTADSGCDVARDESRVEYLAELLRTTAERFELEAYSFREVVCRDERQCRRTLADLLDETARAYAGVLERLVGAGLLDASEASGLKPDFTLFLYDQRERRTFPLPEKLDGVKLELFGGSANEDGGGGSPPPAARR